MHVTMDLNNEKIQMRKEIKRAKVWVGRKLVRQIRSLENKKGNEVMVTKNKRRAQRLEEELDIIKDLKPDDVFKLLINLPLVDKEDCEKKTVKPQQTLQERAVTRIGSVSFIRSAMTGIKSNVSAFHQIRSGKDTSAVDSELTDAVRRPLANQNTVKESGEKDDCENITKSTNLGEVGHGDDFSSGTVIHKNASTVNKDVTSPICDDAGFPNSDEDETPAGVRNAENVEGTQELPIDALVGDKTDHKPNLEEIAQGYDDITQVLTNIGDGFNSDDSGANSGIELEDLIGPSGKDDSSCKDRDAFFLNWTGAINQKCEGGGKAVASYSSDDDELKQVRSCFVESLASVSHQRNKGKNRPSQRARRRLAKKDDGNSRGDGRKEKLSQTCVNTAIAQPDRKSKATENAPLHPSWEASRKRKQEQSRLQEFKGKRVCFDDSD